MVSATRRPRPSVSSVGEVALDLTLCNLVRATPGMSAIVFTCVGGLSRASDELGEDAGAGQRENAKMLHRPAAESRLFYAEMDSCFVIAEQGDESLPQKRFYS